MLWSGHIYDLKYFKGLFEWEKKKNHSCDGKHIPLIVNELHTWMISSQNDAIKMMLQECSNIVTNNNKLHVATNWLIVNNNFSFSDMTLFKVL